MMLSDHPALGNAAVALAELGYRVFPCRPGEKTPATAHGCLDATCDIDTIEQWWTANPSYNIGVSTDGLLVVDVDAKDGVTPEWFTPETADRLTSSAGAVVRTPRDGWHLWYRQPDGVELRNTTSKIAPGIDTRGSGGYVVCYPSLTATGAYTAVAELDRSPEDLPVPPRWLLDQLRSDKTTASPKPETNGHIPEGGRNDYLMRRGGALRRAGLTVDEIDAALQTMNVSRCKPPLPTDEVAKIAESVSRYAPDEKTAAEVTRPPFRINSITAAEFAAADYRQRFYIRKILVANQMCIVGGAQKTLKTSITGDMLFSLGTGTRFLNEFDVPEAVPVGFISAESGEFGLQEVFRRIAFARGRLLSSAMLHMYFRPVQLGRSDHLDALVKWIHRYELKVLAIDPAFLCMSVDDSGQAINFASVFSVGSILSRFMEAIIGAGCTPIINHHESKGANSFRRRGDHSPPELADLSMAGFAEAARQWLLIARREPYEHGGGFHQLWLNAGGSAGHGGLWAVDIDEGQLQDDFTGRKWEVSVRYATEARKATEETKEAAADQREAAKAERELAHAVDRMRTALAANPDGLTFARLRDGYAVPRKWIEPAADALVEAGEAERCDITASNKQDYPGVRLKCSPGNTRQHSAAE